MDLFADLKDCISRDEPMSRHTTLRVGGPARYFAVPRDLWQLSQLTRRCAENELPIYVLGRGSNLLVRDEGLAGVVVRPSAEPFRQVRVAGNRIIAGAGAEMSQVIFQAVRSGLAGLECMIGIPGSVGGCVKTNAGGNAGNIGAVTQRLSLMSRTGRQYYRQVPELDFGYRRSNVAGDFIIEAEFVLHPDDPQCIMRRLRGIWIIKKNSQPLRAHSAGCIFRNPPGCSAGELIDRAGLKGTRIGGAAVSTKHANFIITDGGARSTDVLELIELIRRRVHERFGVSLELEIEIW